MWVGRQESSCKQRRVSHPFAVEPLCHRLTTLDGFPGYGLFATAPSPPPAIACRSASRNDTGSAIAESCITRTLPSRTINVTGICSGTPNFSCHCLPVAMRSALSFCFLTSLSIGAPAYLFAAQAYQRSRRSFPAMIDQQYHPPAGWKSSQHLSASYQVFVREIKGGAFHFRNASVLPGLRGVAGRICQLT
jgi:hypothetical protein